MVIAGKLIDVAIGGARYIIQALEHIGHGGEDLGKRLHLNLNLNDAGRVSGLHGGLSGNQSRIGCGYRGGHPAEGFVKIHHAGQAGGGLK